MNKSVDNSLLGLLLEWAPVISVILGIIGLILNNKFKWWGKIKIFFYKLQKRPPYYNQGIILGLPVKWKWQLSPLNEYEPDYDSIRFICKKCGRLYEFNKLKIKKNKYFFSCCDKDKYFLSLDNIQQIIQNARWEDMQSPVYCLLTTVEERTIMSNISEHILKSINPKWLVVKK